MYYKTYKAHAILGIPVSASNLIEVSEVRNCQCDLPEATTRDRANKFCSFCGNRIWKQIQQPIPEWAVKGRILYAKGEVGNKEESLQLIYSDSDLILFMPGKTLQIPQYFFMVAGDHVAATVPDTRTEIDNHVKQASTPLPDLKETQAKVERILQTHGINADTFRPFNLYAVLERNVMASEPRG